MLTAEERGCTQTSWMGRGLWKNVSIHSFIAQCPLKSIERFGGARGYTWQLCVCYSTPYCVDLGIIRVCYVTSQGFHVTAVSTLIQPKSLDVRYYTVLCVCALATTIASRIAQAVSYFAALPQTAEFLRGAWRVLCLTPVGRFAASIVPRLIETICVPRAVGAGRRERSYRMIGCYNNRRRCTFTKTAV